MAILEIRELAKVRLLDAEYHIPTIALGPGECLAIFSQSAARVADFMRIVAGQLPPEGITVPPQYGCVKASVLDLGLEKLPIFVSGQRLYDGNSYKRIGFIDSDPESIIGRTVQEEYFYALVAGGGRAEKRLAGLDLRPFDLSDKLDLKTIYLSGGEKQKLQTAGALAGSDKQLVVADLSTSNLDNEFVKWFLQEINGFCRDAGAVVISGLRREQFATLTNTTIHYLVLEENSAVISCIERDPDITTYPALDDEQQQLQKKLKQRNLHNSFVVDYKGVRRRGITATVTLLIRAGEIVRLTGPNGSGKTTIGNIIMGLVPDRELVGSKKIGTGIKPAIARQFPDRSLIGRNIKDELPSEKLRHLCGLNNDDLARNPRDLSFGTRKLITVASTLLVAHGLAILDEPTCGMNFTQKQRFVELLNEFQETAVLIITHDEGLAKIGREVQMGGS